MKDLFHIFRTNEAVEVEDLADFQVILLDAEQPTQAAMAITALTLYQLEHGYDRGRFQMLLWAMSRHCAEVVRARALVGLLLICDVLCSLFVYPLPISTISALFGAPIIIWIILKNK